MLIDYNLSLTASYRFLAHVSMHSEGRNIWDIIISLRLKWLIIMGATIRVLIFFLFIRGLREFSDYIKLGVLRPEGWLRCVRVIRGCIRYFASVFQLIFCNLEYAQVRSEVFQSMRELRWKVLDLLHSENTCIELREYLTKLNVIKLLYK